MIELTNTVKTKSKTKREGKKTSVFSMILWAVVYFVLVISLCLSGTWAFSKYYYYTIYVSGPSMEPTLNGGSWENSRLDFGFIDTHKSAINSINRFDIITTFFPFDEEDYALPYVHGSKPLEDSATHKIKRVMAIPGDTFTIRNDEYFLLVDGEETKIDFNFEVKKNNFNPEHLKYTVDFKTKGIGDENGYVTLAEDEYWVMGDNWTVSKDSYSHQIGGPVYKENIIGVLIAIVGTCLVKRENDKDVIYDEQYTFPTFYK